MRTRDTARTTTHAAAIARTRTSHSDKGASRGQRGRSAATASNAGTVTSRVSETRDGPLRGECLRVGAR
ncbi:hypothetical protein FNV68_47390 [Streptomyces sp. S1D4-23]|nr:hypothetical protein FNV68_47390 [Streptomyces sp. S1D4-23]